jgi:hypothetical protein
VRSLGATAPRLANGIVRVPVHFDDFALHARGQDLAEWEAAALAAIDAGELVVFSLHDCYAHLWLDGYEPFLERVLARARPITVDELAAHVTLATSA